jgi:hypothetical protein
MLVAVRRVDRLRSGRTALERGWPPGIQMGIWRAAAFLVVERVRLEGPSGAPEGLANLGRETLRRGGVVGRVEVVMDEVVVGWRVRTWT